MAATRAADRRAARTTLEIRQACNQQELQLGGISMIKSLLGGIVCRHRTRHAQFDRDGRTRKSSAVRPPIRSASRLGGRHQVLQVPEEGGPLPHRARQRLHRQHLAHPDDPDRQGLCGAAGRRGQAQGIQGRLDRRGRAGADRGDQQLHRFRLRRDRRQRAEPDGLRRR